MSINPFTVDNAHMSALIAQALFSGMSEEGKQAMLLKALQDSLAAQIPERQNSGYGRPDNRSRFQTAFDEAVHTVTREVVAESLKTNSDIKKAMEQMVVDAFTKFTDRESAEWGKITAAISDGIERAFSKDR
jgi:hypothetical protein